MLCMVVYTYTYALNPYSSAMTKRKHAAQPPLHSTDGRSQRAEGSPPLDVVVEQRAGRLDDVVQRDLERVLPKSRRAGNNRAPSTVTVRFLVTVHWVFHAHGRND